MTATVAVSLNRLNYAQVFISVTDLYDHNNSGTIDILEFKRLFEAINQWKTTFESFDKDRSGRIEQSELTQGDYFKICSSLC